MFASQANKLNFMPSDGMKIMVTGRVSVYEATGGYQIYVEDMIQDGVGNLYIEYEKLKKKLASEGLFDASKKKKSQNFQKQLVLSQLQQVPLLKIFYLPLKDAGQLRKQFYFLV